jgi:hypothetical protein
MAAYCSAHAETVAWNIWRSMRHQEKISYKQRKNFTALNKTLDARLVNIIEDYLLLKLSKLFVKWGN